MLVFKSADPDYFIPHVDVTQINEYRAEAAKLTGEASIGLMFRYLSASRLVSIAQIEGRVRAAGSEFVLACDMRFAARESAIFGDIPNSSAIDRLWRITPSFGHKLCGSPFWPCPRRNSDNGKLNRAFGGLSR